jgi:selenocysteine lyase/cysteine desulfurase
VLSDAVRAAYGDYLEDWDSKGAPWEYWMERTESARHSFAGLVGAHDDEIAVTASVSAGVNAIASGLPRASGRTKVVISDFEFPTVGQIWHAQEARGYTIEHVAQGGAPIVPLEAFDAAIDENTALVAVTQVCYRNGACIDLEGVIKLAHERGALVLVDSYQAIGTMPIDVHALGVDLLVAGALKYLLASAGLGFLYCRRELVEQLRPTATGWFADADVFAMDIQDYSPAPDARRFQAGTPPIPSIYAGIAGIELMKEIGIEATRAHVTQLNEVLIAGIDELGATVVTPRDATRRGALVAIRSSDEHALVGALAEEGVLTSSRDGNLRVSAHCYNAHEDIEALLAALRRHRRLLAA